MQRGKKRMRTRQVRLRFAADDYAGKHEKGAGVENPLYNMVRHATPVPDGACKLFYVFHSVC